MRKFIHEKILHINKATGVEIIIMPDDTFIINTYTAVTRKNSIIPQSFTTGLLELKKMPSKIDAGIPLAVVINGKGVLTKIIPSTYQKDNPLATILPGANPIDFYYEIYKTSQLTTISVIRKQAADAILSGLKEMGFSILSVSCGFNTLSAILLHLQTNYEAEVDASSFRITLGKDNEIAGFEINNEITKNLTVQHEYLVAGHYIKSSQLLCYAASVNLLTDNISLPAIMPSTLVNEQREDFKYYKYFRFAGLTVLAVFFFVLLTSFLLYDHYYKLNREMERVQSIDNVQAKRVVKEQMDIRQKEKFLSRSGWISTGRISYYADRIANLTPADVLLTHMNLYPLKTGLFDGSGSINFKKDTIEVSGICYDPVLLTQFINGLKIIPDFTKVTAKSYQYRKEDEAGVFLIEIITR